MESALKFLHEDPIVSFAILLAVILAVPILFERFRIPGLVGLLAAGVVLGPNGLKLFQSESETMELLSDIGLLYLMFVAGLEIDLEEFGKVKYRSFGFGSLTFFLPLITGTIIGRLFNFDWNASVLIGSLLASHSLLCYPIVNRLGVAGNQAVIVTLGATIFTDISALIVLAICIGIGGGDFSTVKLLILLASVAVYAAVILFGFNWLGRQFFRRSGDEEGNQFLFVLLVVFLAALGAELIGVEKIVGAFLSGFAVNEVVGEGPVKEKLVFVGSVLFIPIFFVDIGLQIDVAAFVTSVAAIGLALVITTGLLASKFMAALLAKLLYRYKWRQMLTMWSMTIPQVTTTLAAALVGNQAGLLSEDVLNGVIVMMLVTATVGPVIATRAAGGLSLPAEPGLKTDVSLLNWEQQSPDHPFTVMVPVYNPETERDLIEMAALLAAHEEGRIVPIAITLGHAHMDAPRLEGALQQSKNLLTKATELSQEFGVEAEPVLRIDDKVSQGISRASREQNASLIIMGWGNRSGFRARLFGNVIDEVLWATHCPVAITRLLDSPRHIRRILVPVESLSYQAARKIRFTQILADENQAQVTVLHVCDRRTPGNRRASIQAKLSSLVDQLAPDHSFEIQVIPNNDIVRTVLQQAKGVDLVVLRSRRQRTEAGLAISDVTTRITQQLDCSVVMLGEPHHA